MTAPADTPHPAGTPATPPHIWWSPFVGLLVSVQGGRARFLEPTAHDPVALPEDAVQLVAVGVPHSAFSDGSAFVARQRALHTRTDDGPWCSCGIGHCGMRVLLDHLDHAQAEIAEAQRSANVWKGQAEYWEREHQHTVLPYTAALERERDDLQGKPRPVGEVR